jgi:methyl-accepting chemotaxis protein
MLATSGAVEAARAGDVGRGFAVVSGDIRTLARDAGANADTVKELVATINAQIGKVRREVDQDPGGDRAGGRSQSLDRRTLAVGDGRGRGSARRLRRDRQERGGHPVGELAGAGRRDPDRGRRRGGQFNAAFQAATAARQQSQSAEDLAAAIEEIALLAGELQQAAKA